MDPIIIHRNGIEYGGWNSWHEKEKWVLKSEAPPEKPKEEFDFEYWWKHHKQKVRDRMITYERKKAK